MGSTTTRRESKNCQRWSWLAFLALCALSLCCCQRHAAPAGSTTTGQGSGTQPAGPRDKSGAPPAPKQIVIIYSGDTRSILTANTDYDPPEGGLSALAHAIGDYELQVTDYNRLRVENAGGDPGGVKVDYARGMLGEHPYLLLDYGGWERPNDYAGAPYVALYLRMFADLHYTAVGGQYYEILSAERWGQYAALDTDTTVLASAGSPKAGALPGVPIITREMHGSLWGIVCAPLPDTMDKAEQRFSEYIDIAEGVLQQNGCQAGILLAAGGSAELYRKLSENRRLRVIIGCPQSMAPPTGFGKLSPDKPLLLPALNGGGRQLAVCHLIFGEKSTQPEQFFFDLLKVEEDAAQPYPYRNQVRQAAAEHAALVEAHNAAL